MKERGFTLIEIILTIMVMAVLGFMAAQLLSTSLRGSAESVGQVQDLSEAASVMEECVALFNKETLIDASVDERSAAAQSFAKDREGVTVNPWPEKDKATNVLVTVKRGVVELSRVF